MRTTVTLPDDLHDTLTSISRDRSQTVSQTMEQLLRVALRPAVSESRLERSPVTGLLTIRLDRMITQEDVRALEDEE